MFVDEDKTVVSVTRRQALAVAQDQARDAGFTITVGFSTASSTGLVAWVAHSIDEHETVVGVARGLAFTGVLVNNIRGNARSTIGVVGAVTSEAGSVARDAITV